MAKVTMKDLMNMRKEYKVGDVATMYSQDFKDKVIQFHYDTGVSLRIISTTLHLSYDSVAKWKRRTGTERTAYVHGKRMRYDIRTKALAVRDFIENNIQVPDIATEMNVSKGAVYLWIEKYQDNYNQLIDAPDGIPYIVAEKKMVYGNDNIEKIRNVLRQQYETLMCMIDTMHMTGDQADLMKKCAEESLKKEKELIEAVETLESNGIDLNIK